MGCEALQVSLPSAKRAEDADTASGYIWGCYPHATVHTLEERSIVTGRGAEDIL